MSRRTPLYLLVVAVVCVGPIVFGQEATLPADQPFDPDAVKLLQKLKATEAYRRNEVAQELVKLGKAAVLPPLVAELKGFRKEPDTNYIANCILVLGQIEELDRSDRRAATDVLISALGAPSAQIKYCAARALKDIWQREAAADVETLRTVNAALMSSLCKMPPSPAVYGPGLALFEINNIPLGPDTSRLPGPASLTPEQLRDAVEEWAADSPGLLPELEEQPWPLLLARVRRHPDPEARQRAKDLLVARRPLMAVDTVVRYLKTEGLSESVWKELADVLTGISGRGFPRVVAEENREAAVTEWMRQWEDALKGRRDEAYRRYSWQRFELAVARAESSPDVSLIERVAQLREVLVNQLDGPADIPGDASPMARTMVEKVLWAKQQYVAALNGLRQASLPDQKMAQIMKLQEVVDGEGGKSVSRQFLDDLIALTRTEERQEVLNLLARLLTSTTNVPLRFSAHLTPRERNNAIDMWLQKVRDYEASSPESQ